MGRLSHRPNVEGSTIIAIVLGAVIGARLADRNIATALGMITLLYLVSLFATLFIRGAAATQHDHAPALRAFVSQMGSFFDTSRARFSMIGAAIFWAAAVVLRVMLVAWAPVGLLTSTTSEIANLTVFIALGIAVGSVIVPWLIPIERLRRARLAAYLMGILIMLLGLSDSAVSAKAVLFAIGFSGGLFVVPINAALQEIGHRTIGSGSAVAIPELLRKSCHADRAILALLVGLFIPRNAERAAAAATGKPVVAGGLGCLTLLIAPVMLVLLFISFCGIPFSLLGLFLLLAAWALGIIALGLETGKRLADLMKQDWALPVSAMIGTFLLTLLINGLGALVPCIGWVVPALVGMVGLGAALVQPWSVAVRLLGVAALTAVLGNALVGRVRTGVSMGP